MVSGGIWYWGNRSIYHILCICIHMFSTSHPLTIFLTCQQINPVILSDLSASTKFMKPFAHRNTLVDGEVSNNQSDVCIPIIIKTKCHILSVIYGNFIIISSYCYLIVLYHSVCQSLSWLEHIQFIDDDPSEWSSTYKICIYSVGPPSYKLLYKPIVI